MVLETVATALYSLGNTLTRLRALPYAALCRPPQASCIRNAPSRGKLTRDFLEGTWSPLAYLQQLPIADYNGYNLIVGDLRSMELAYGSNRGETAVHGPRLLAPGVYGLSNAGLDTPWPKVRVCSCSCSCSCSSPQRNALPQQTERRAGDAIPQLESEQRSRQSCMVCSASRSSGLL